MHNKKHGFTLIELLVVISIIAILMAIMMPALSKARNMARRVICGSHMHNMGVAIENYKADSNGDYPIAFWDKDSFKRRIYTESLIKAGIIRGEETVPGKDEWVVSAGADREAYSCPSFRRFLKVMPTVFTGWGQDIQEHYPIGYGYNTHLSRYDKWDDTTNQLVLNNHANYIGKTPRSSTLMLIDAAGFMLRNDEADSKFYPVYDIAERYVNYNGIIAGSHTGAMANSLFVDMHVESRKADDYITRDSNDPTTLVGSSILNHQSYKYKDNGYSRSVPAGKIACPE